MLNAIDRALIGGRVGKVCGYIFSPKTPLIMVPSNRRKILIVDDIPLSYDWRDIHILSNDMETYPWTRCITNTLVRTSQVWLIYAGGLYSLSFQHRTFHSSSSQDQIQGSLHLKIILNMLNCFHTIIYCLHHITNVEHVNFQNLLEVNIAKLVMPA